MYLLFKQCLLCDYELQKWYWKQLKNIMYKEKKFIMEIIDNNPHSQLKHTTSSPGIITDQIGSKKPQSAGGSEAIITYTWYSTPKVVLALWRMAKVQHKFSKGKSTSVRTITYYLFIIVFVFKFVNIIYLFMCSLVVQGEALDPAELIKRLNTLLVAPSNLRRSPSESQNSISSSGSSNPSMCYICILHTDCKMHSNQYSNTWKILINATPLHCFFMWEFLYRTLCM